MSLATLSAPEVITPLLAELESSAPLFPPPLLIILEVSLAFFFLLHSPKRWFKDEHLIGTAYTLCVDAENSGRVF
jgi:hypothetical protein